MREREWRRQIARSPSLRERHGAFGFSRRSQKTFNHDDFSENTTFVVDAGLPTEKFELIQVGPQRARRFWSLTFCSTWVKALPCNPTAAPKNSALTS